MSSYGHKQAIKLASQIQQINRKKGNSTDQVAKLLSSQSTQRLAALLNQYAELRHQVFSCLDAEAKVKVLDVVNLHTRRSLIGRLSDAEAIHLFEVAPSAIDQKIAQVIERSRLDQLIAKISDEQRRANLVQFANYPQRSVGRITQIEVVVVTPQTSVVSALKEVAGFGVVGGSIYQVYVCDEKDQFLGMISVSDLAGANPNKVMSDLDLKKPPLITPQMTQKRVAQIFQEYDLVEAPVIKDKKLVGRVLVYDVLDVVQQEFTQDLQKFAGITDDETLDTPVLGSSRRRLPWMVVNIFLDLIAVSVILPFEATIGQVTALAVLMPIVSDMGGNVGVQALAVSVRGMANTRPRWWVLLRELRKEIKLGMLNGLVLGVVIGIVGAVGWGNPYLGLVTTIALFFNTIVASIVGGLLPIVFKKYNCDPAMMSGAILTTITDFTGFLIFLGLARMFLEYLI